MKLSTTVGVLSDETLDTFRKSDRSKTPIGQLARILADEDTWSNEFQLCFPLQETRFAFLSISHPALSEPLILDGEHPTMAGVIDRILEICNIEKSGIDQEIRVLQEKRSGIEHTANRIRPDIAIAAAREKYPAHGKIRLYSKWTDFDIYLVDTDTANGVFNAPIFIRMNDLHEVVEVLLLERITYFMWTKLDDHEQLRELLVARAIEALLSVDYVESVGQIVKGSFQLSLGEADPKKFWGSLSVSGITLIGFDETTKMAHIVEPRLPAADGEFHYHRSRNATD